MDKVIVVEYGGWCKIEPANAKFHYCGSDDTKDGVITGDKWIELNEDDRSDYILESLTDTINNSYDSDFTDISISIEED